MQTLQARCCTAAASQPHASGSLLAEQVGEEVSGTVTKTMAFGILVAAFSSIHHDLWLTEPRFWSHASGLRIPGVFVDIGAERDALYVAFSEQQRKKLSCQASWRPEGLRAKVWRRQPRNRSPTPSLHTSLSKTLLLYYLSSTRGCCELARGR